MPVKAGTGYTHAVWTCRAVPAPSGLAGRPLTALGALRVVRVLDYLSREVTDAGSYMPQPIYNALRFAAGLLLACVAPLLVGIVLLTLCGGVFLLIGRELLPPAVFGGGDRRGEHTLYSNALFLARLTDFDEWAVVLQESLTAARTGADITTGGPSSGHDSGEVFAVLFAGAWAAVAHGVVLSCTAVALLDAAERRTPDAPPPPADELDPHATPLMNTVDAVHAGARPPSAKPRGRFVHPEELVQMLEAYGIVGTSRQDAERFFALFGERAAGGTLRLPALLRQLEISAMVGELFASQPMLYVVGRGLLQATRALLALDVIVELWLWLGLLCLRSGAAFDCWVPQLVLTESTGSTIFTAPSLAIFTSCF